MQLDRPVIEALATTGVFTRVGPDRRAALWAAGAAATRAEHLPGLALGHDAPALPGMSAFELASADLWATGITDCRHPIEFLRAHLDGPGAIPAGWLLDVADRTLSVPAARASYDSGSCRKRQRTSRSCGR
ncbi:hypothetical protein AB0F91_46985 [Amycolatopsis sp. NPDC023774]|uniref:hypothetical protein n=1 Tax=Amycolatopsis sp. NPDC023774 TaxID=3155015 RepID=UPI00340CAD94